VKLPRIVFAALLLTSCEKGGGDLFVEFRDENERYHIPSHFVLGGMGASEVSRSLDDASGEILIEIPVSKLAEHLGGKLVKANQTHVRILIQKLGDKEKQGSLVGSYVSDAWMGVGLYRDRYILALPDLDLFAVKGLGPQVYFATNPTLGGAQTYVASCTEILSVANSYAGLACKAPVRLGGFRLEIAFGGEYLGQVAELQSAVVSLLGSWRVGV
jgi:hypothetical protein